jgi:hypothetical protein
MVALGVITLIVGLIGGGTIVSVTNNSPKEVTDTVTDVKTETVTVTGVDETEELEPGSVGLEELNEEEDVEFEVAASFGNRTIGRTTYTNAVTGGIYADGSGFSQLPIFTKGRFDSMHFAVGIDAEATCPRARGTVSVEDQVGRVLWGPRDVSINQPVIETVSIPRPLQVVLVQRSNETESSCDYGVAEISWGDVTFAAG